MIYYGYDNVGRLTDETWFAADSPAIYAFEWDYDYVGNRTYQKNGTDQSCYEHNSADELTRLYERGSPEACRRHYAQCVPRDRPVTRRCGRAKRLARSVYQ